MRGRCDESCTRRPERSGFHEHRSSSARHNELIQRFTTEYVDGNTIHSLSTGEACQGRTHNHEIEHEGRAEGHQPFRKTAECYYFKGPSVRRGARCRKAKVEDDETPSQENTDDDIVRKERPRGRF